MPLGHPTAPSPVVAGLHHGRKTYPWRLTGGGGPDLTFLLLFLAEISRINTQLESRESEVADLTDCLARLSIEAEGRGAVAAGLAQQKAVQEAQIIDMQREIAAKDELVRCSFGGDTVS